MNDPAAVSATLPANRPCGKCSWTLLVMAGLAASHVAGSDRSLQTVMSSGPLHSPGPFRLLW